MRITEVDFAVVLAVEEVLVEVEEVDVVVEGRLNGKRVGPVR